jgi:hypothetical protein
MKRTALALIVVLLAAGACSRPDALSGMQLRRDGGGDVHVLRDGKSISVGSTIEIEPGDIIETEKGARATFALEGGEDDRKATLQPDTRVVVASPTEFEVEAGHALVEVKATTTTQFDDVTASTSSASYRIDRDFGSTRLGVYVGGVGLDATGQVPLDVNSYFQATVVAGDLPSVAIPYQLRLQDAWDQSLLKEQVTLEGDLEQLGQGLENQLGLQQRVPLDYFSELAGGKPVGFMKEYLKRKPTDLLIGFTIARNASGSLEDAFTDAFGYFDDGAKWSIASAILDVKSKPILASLESLLVATGVIAADGGTTGGQAEFSVATAEAANNGQPSADSPNTASEQPTGSDPGSDPGGEDPPPNKPDKDPPQECSSSAECGVQDVMDQIPGPSPSPTGASDLIDGEL